MARAKLASSEQHLSELKAGPTKEEIDQAEANLRQAQSLEAASKSVVDQAQAQLDLSKKDVQRQRELFEQGAISKADNDRSETALRLATIAVQTAQDQFEATSKSSQSAMAKLKQLKVGTRAEQIAQAAADVEAARATLAGVQQSGPAQIDSLLSSPRIEDIKVAQAHLTESIKNRQLAHQRLADTVVRAPYDGVVTKLLLNEGSVTGPAQAILKLIHNTTLEIRADIDEVNLGRLKSGQEVLITSDAYPDASFKSVILRLGTQVDSDKGSIEIVLRPLEKPVWLRPGMTMTANIIVSRGLKHLTVPLTAVKTINNRSIVFVVRDSVVAEQVVKVSPAGTDSIPVVSGLKADDLVVIDSAGVEGGKSVATKLISTVGGK